MSTVSSLLLSAVFGAWSVSSAVAVSGWIALSLQEAKRTRRRRLPPGGAEPPIVV